MNNPFLEWNAFAYINFPVLSYKFTVFTEINIKFQQPDNKILFTTGF